jgi:CRISPR-associated endonuclease/helicase Cas3
LIEMILAAISHHGRPVTHADVARDSNPIRWWRCQGRVDPMAGIAELTSAARMAFPSAFESGPRFTASPSVQHRFAGLVMLADWIGSDTRYFPYRDDPQQDRLGFASGQADRALAAIGLVPPAFRLARPFEEVLRPHKPSPLQQLMDVGLSGDDDSRIALVESETGSGKTESALAWFLRLYRDRLVDGLYFALPTRVAARELYERVRGFIDAAFPDPTTRPGPVLLAAPGYVRVDGQALLVDPDGTLWEDDATERRRERQWAAAHPKRFLAAPIAVGTIDQALLSVLKVKHALLRSVCLDRSLLVIDEVHASDPYMRQLLQALLEGHLKRGGHALLLSATLGDSAASVLLSTGPRNLSEAEQVPYPAVRTKSKVHPVPAAGPSKRVAVEWVASLEDTAVVPAIIEALAQGARVLAICNTVSRANSLLRGVEASGGVSTSGLFSVRGVVCPHHGRFARVHREVMDATVSARFGAGSPDGPNLIVGTQTLEQSLDIDADWLVSDLCPMDVLLQRIGRLHRHLRHNRPAGFGRARVSIRVPEGMDLARFLRGDDLRAAAGLGLVYPDGRVLQRTLQVLLERGGLELPRDNRSLIEQTTHHEAFAHLSSEWQRHGRAVEGKAAAMRHAALASVSNDLPFGQLTYAAPDEALTTRLGITNWRIQLAHAVSEPFGTTVQEIELPGHMVPKRERLPGQVNPQPTAEGFRFAIGANHYRYTRFGLERDDDA